MISFHGDKLMILSYMGMHNNKKGINGIESDPRIEAELGRVPLNEHLAARLKQNWESGGIQLIKI